MAKTMTLHLPDVFTIEVPKHEKETVDVATGKWNEAFVNRIIRFGLKEYTNNACSGKKGEECKKEAAAAAARMSEMDWGTGGGPRISPFEKELRNVAETQLRVVCQRSGNDARVKDIEAACRDVITTLLARKNGNDPSKVTKADVDKVLPEQLKRWHEAARRSLEGAATLSVV